MEQIHINVGDLHMLANNYPDLKYNQKDNKISGVISFKRSYDGVVIKGKYSIEFVLKHDDRSILPKVRETEGKILNIAKRKSLEYADLHLNNIKGELCLILPIKEKAYYLEGFSLKKFLNHIEEHLYWVTYFDRYNRKPWRDEPHNFEEALINAVREDKQYRLDLKSYKERKEKRKLNRSEFRRFLKSRNLL